MLKIAIKAATEAGELILSYRGKVLAVKNKDRIGDFTTEADLESEKIILKILRTNFPEHNFQSEELGKVDNQSNYQWVIDPLDGTIPFVSGLPIFGVSIGLLYKNQPVLGVINLPVLDQLYWAEKGKGVFLNHKKISVSQKSELEKSVIGFELGHIGDRREELRKLVMPIVDKVRYTPILGCTTAGLCFVASGVFDAYIHWAYPWDFVAGSSIIQEAGGKITDYWGKNIDWQKNNMSVLASNNILHQKILFRLAENRSAH